MIRNGRIVSDYDILRQRARKDATDAHRVAGYPGEHRIRAAGRVVSHNKHSPRLERWFFDHLRTASLTPEAFAFDGAIGKESAAPWLAHQRARLPLPAGLVELVAPDGAVLDSFNLPS